MKDWYQSLWYPNPGEMESGICVNISGNLKENVVGSLKRFCFIDFCFSSLSSVRGMKLSLS